MPTSDRHSRPALSGTVLGGCLVWTVAAGALWVQWQRAWDSAPNADSGWLGAVLVPYFLWLRWRDCPAAQPQPLHFPQWALVIGGGLVLVVARIFLEPFPGWPFVEWAYTGAVATLCLSLVRAWAGPRAARHFVFPFLLGLAALPWPSLVEADWIPRLRLLLASIVAETCNLAGEPAIAHGTVIQIGGASVGIEEACGGIRSLRLAVLIALALGELRRDRWLGRLKWLGGAIFLALLSNGLRLLALTWIRGRFSGELFPLWHDRLDWIELAFLLGCLGAAFLISKSKPTGPRFNEPRKISSRFAPKSTGAVAGAIFLSFAISELSVWLWFGGHDQPATLATPWGAQLSAHAPGYGDDEFTPAMQALLACDQHQMGHWNDSSGARRAGYVIEWDRGQGARFVLLLHNPDICLPASGSQRTGQRPVVLIHQGALDLPFACHEFSDDRGQFYVYYLAWNLTEGKAFGSSGEMTQEGESWFHSQWREVAARRRRIAVRVIAVAIFDSPNGPRADQAFQVEARRILGTD